MKFPFPFKATQITVTTTTSAAAPSWPWPSCAASPKTLSFRANTTDTIHQTINSPYDLDDKNTTEFANITPDSFHRLCNSTEHNHEEILSSESAVVSGLRSDRLFFKPGETNSILEEAKTHESLHKGNVAMMEIDSSHPFLDFRVSMAEMVEAHGLRNWAFLEDLLECYLRVNDRSSHGYIAEAFMDLLIHLASTSASDHSAIDENCSSSSSSSSSSSTTMKYSFTSPLSFSSSTTYSSISPSLENEDKMKNGDGSSSSSLSLSLSFNASSSGV